jgi:hypothetical protein
MGGRRHDGLTPPRWVLLSKSGAVRVGRCRISRERRLARWDHLFGLFLLRRKNMRGLRNSLPAGDLDVTTQANLHSGVLIRSWPQQVIYVL